MSGSNSGSFLSGSLIHDLKDVPPKLSEERDGSLSANSIGQAEGLVLTPLDPSHPSIPHNGCLTPSSTMPPTELQR